MRAAVAKAPRRARRMIAARPIVPGWNASRRTRRVTVITRRRTRHADRATSGSTVHYQAHGSGPGLVMVHGTGGSGLGDFGGIIASFTDVRTVITPDYAGSGSTTDPGG